MDGIDVSQWQGYINFERVRQAGIDLVYIKASEGIDFVDPFFYRNYVNAKRADLSVGFYHDLTARTKEEAKGEAYHFVETTEGFCSEGRLVMVLEDIGGLSRREINLLARTFLEGVQEFSNKSPAIYMAELNSSQIFDAELAVYPLWIAQYDVQMPETEQPWKQWAGWQYTGMGRIAGIQGNVDRDIFEEEMLDTQPEAIKRYGIRPPFPDLPRRYMRYRIQKGDTLYEIARKYGTTAVALAQYNKIKNPNLIYAGQILKIAADS